MSRYLLGLLCASLLSAAVVRGAEGTGIATTQPTSFSWHSDCSAESTFVNSRHAVVPGHYEYVRDPAGNGTVFRGRLTSDLKIDDPESVHLHPDIYFSEFLPGSFTLSADVWITDLEPEMLGPYRDKPWLNVVTVFDRTNVAGDPTYAPSVMVNLVGKPGAYFLQTYTMSPERPGTFFENAPGAPQFPTGRWVRVTVAVNTQTLRVRTSQDGMLVSEGPYVSRPGIAGAHLGLYTNRLMKRATVYNRNVTLQTWRIDR